MCDKFGMYAYFNNIKNEFYLSIDNVLISDLVSDVGFRARGGAYCDSLLCEEVRG